MSILILPHCSLLSVSKATESEWHLPNLFYILEIARAQERAGCCFETLDEYFDSTWIHIFLLFGCLLMIVLFSLECIFLWASFFLLDFCGFASSLKRSTGQKEHKFTDISSKSWHRKAAWREIDNNNPCGTNILFCLLSKGNCKHHTCLSSSNPNDNSVKHGN